MYLGRPIEQGPRDDVFERPLHPYTRALQASSPSTDPGKRSKRLMIKGELPSPIDPPPGCAFHPRCPFAERALPRRGAEAAAVRGLARTTTPAMPSRSAACPICPAPWRCRSDRQPASELLVRETAINDRPPGSRPQPTARRTARRPSSTTPSTAPPGSIQGGQAAERDDGLAQPAQQHQVGSLGGTGRPTVGPPLPRSRSALCPARRSARRSRRRGVRRGDRRGRVDAVDQDRLQRLQDQVRRQHLARGGRGRRPS